MRVQRCFTQVMLCLILIAKHTEMKTYAKIKLNVFREPASKLHKFFTLAICPLTRFKGCRRLTSLAIKVTCNNVLKAAALQQVNITGPNKTFLFHELEKLTYFANP